MLKNITLISYQYSRASYKEDDWQIIRIIKNKSDLYEALKEGYLQDARNRNNFPLCSFSIGRIFTYDDLSQYEDYTWLGGDYDNEYSYEYNDDIKDLRDYDSSKDLEIRSKFSNIFEKFNKWEKKVKSLIPKIRKRAEIISNEKKELKRLFELANKFNYELIKK